MYTTKNFKTKKELKAAVLAYNNDATLVKLYEACPPFSLGAVLFNKMKERGFAPAVTYFQVGPFGGNEPRDGVFCCEGPHYPEPHRWYATCTAKDGKIIKVK